jgi:tetratricopeptide (TPR) repeat protein
VLFAPSFSRADAIWLDKPTGAPMFADTKITRVENGSMFFLVAGNETSRELSRIGRISVTDEPALTQAEDAFSQGKWDDAVDAYEKASKSSAKPWVREWAAGRLVEASSKSGRFDAAVAAYIASVSKDPTAAATARPELPDYGSTYLDTAAQQVNSTLASAKLNDAQRTALLTFLIEIHVRRRDEAAANAAGARLDEILARDPDNPAAAKAVVRKKLQLAATLIDQKQYTKAIAEIDSDRSIFTDHRQQAQALYLLADAQSRLALASNDRTQLQDAALAYLRVAAHFKEVPNVPEVPTAMLGAAVLCERLGDSAAAKTLYEEVAASYAENADVAAAARQGIDRLRNQK